MQKDTKTYRTGVANDIQNVIETNQQPCRWDFLFEYLKEKNVSIKILDVGCGTGNKMLSLLDAGYKNTVGVEYNPEAYQEMVAKHQQLRIVEGNAEELAGFGGGFFDLVYCSQVLEHLPYPEKAVSEAYRVLKRGGAYVIGIPNGNHLDDILSRVVQKVLYGKYDHLQRFTLKSISKILERNSFKIVEVSARKDALPMLLDHRIKFRWLPHLIYNLFKKLYWRDINFDILAVKA